MVIVNNSQTIANTDNCLNANSNNINKTTLEVVDVMDHDVRVNYRKYIVKKIALVV